MSGSPAPNQLRWMAVRAALLAAVAGVAVAFLFGGMKELGSAAMPMALLIGSLAAATSFAVSMVMFVVTLPRMQPGSAVWLSLALGAIASFVVGTLLQPISVPA